MCPGEEAVAAYVAGRMERDERDAIDAHLDTCSGCQEVVAMLAKLDPSRGSAAATLEEVVRDSWTPGGQLGRYVLLARLGAGGMGVVYAAYDPELDRRVALKVLRRARAGEQLRAEARAIAKLAHPNVIAVHDVGTADDEVFVAMEHVDGMTLRDWLKQPRTRAAILDIFVQAGRGLAAAHRAGLVHRDIKPSNIMVGVDGRARVLDFGLARVDGDREPTGGTPAYMAPEQERGEPIDARADQFAFCVALWEALTTRRPKPGESGSIDGVSDRVVRALRRGLAERPDDRFPSLDKLLDELAPRTRQRWMIATLAALAALVGALAFAVTREQAAPSCVRAGDPLDRVWGDPQRAAIRSSFAATKLPYAASAATTAIAELDRWTARWRASAIASCKATVVERVQPAELHALRTSCLAQLLERLQPVVALASRADASVVARADVLATSLAAPERCDDVAALGAVAPPPERFRTEVASVRAAIAEVDAELLAGHASAVRDKVSELVKRADATGYAPLRAQAQLLVARLEKAASRYERAVPAYHAAAQAAAAARELPLLAEIWIEASQVLGNDVRTLDQAAVFDGYAASLIPSLPDRAALAVQLEFARCNRNGGAAEAETLARHCQATIDQALALSPPRERTANAARTRLGHYQRLQGRDDEALATLAAAADEAVRVHGPAHPDTAVARYSLGIALLSADRVDDGIVQLRQALDIRRAAYPAGSIQIAESLQGLGDALGIKGEHDEAIARLEQALAMLDQVQQADSVQAVNSHILLGMTLEEVKRGRDALPHYLRAADIANRTLQRRESLAAMALRLAANIEAERGDVAAAIAYVERALRMQERGKAPPAELAKTAQLLAELKRRSH